MLGKMSVDEAVAELRPFYPKMKRWSGHGLSALYLNDESKGSVWAGWASMRVECDAIWRAIWRAISNHRAR